MLSMAGMYRMESYIDKAKLIFFGRLCRLRTSCLSKQIFATRLFSYLENCTAVNLGFIKDICRILSKYDLYDHLLKFSQVASFPGKNPWKHIVSRAIKKYENLQYESRINGDYDFKLFKMIEPCISEPSRIWSIVQLVPKWSKEMYSLAKATMCVRECVNIKDCHLCKKYVHDGNFVVHAANACVLTQNARDKMWSSISNKLTTHTSAFLNSLDSIDFTCIILGAPLDITQCEISAEDYVDLIHISAQFWHICGYLTAAEEQ